MWDRFKTFMSEPFKSDMSALDWFLFIGLIIIIQIMWVIILRHVREAV